MKVKRTERGLAGHYFICARDCLFRRNTLIESGREKIVVSTVGAYFPPNSREIKTIGAGGRYYETMAFKAKKVDGYWEIDAFNQIDFDSEWSICADSVKNLQNCVDIEADKMHEKVVGEMIEKLNKEAPPQG